VALHVEVSCVFLDPEKIGVCKHVIYAQNISFLSVVVEILNLERIRN